MFISGIMSFLVASTSALFCPLLKHPLLPLGRPQTMSYLFAYKSSQKQCIMRVSCSLSTESPKWQKDEIHTLAYWTFCVAEWSGTLQVQAGTLLHCYTSNSVCWCAWYALHCLAENETPQMEIPDREECVSQCFTWRIYFKYTEELVIDCFCW